MNGFDSIRVRQRAVVAQWVLTGAFLVLIGAFFRTQVVQHDKYQLKAETNRLRPVTIAAPRGQILDYKGRIIAENVPGYTVKLLTAKKDSLEAILHRIATVVPLDSAAIDEMVRRHRQAPYQPVTVFGDADFATVSRLEEHRALFPGIVVQAEPKRLYPTGKAVAHLVGYTAEVNETDLAQKRYPGAELGTIVGKAGLEREYDDRLRGREGVRYMEVNARGRLVREEGASPVLPPDAGTPIRTTIDLDLQQFIDSIWPAGVRGAMVAITPQGEIRALYSAPSYDPNLFTGGISAGVWRELNGDSAKPLLNRAIYARYPPASTFKLATAAMALKLGIIDLHTRMPVPCTGGMRVGNRYWKCWDKRGHGNVDLTGAVAGSCDVYFYQVGLKLGIKNILDQGVAMGFADKTGIDLPSELRPLYPRSTEYFDKLYGPRGWTPIGPAMNFSIGQGENTQTLISMMRFYQALAGNGEEVAPFIVPPEHPEKPRSLGLTEDQLMGLREALISVVERGTAAGATRRSSNGAVLAIAGKTGTAQNPHGKDHGWFIGFAPADHPKLVVGGIFEFGQHGTVVVPYVVRALRRYILGPDAPPLDSTRIQVNNTDEAPTPRPDDLAPDSAPPAAPAPAAPAPAAPAPAAPTPATPSAPSPRPAPAGRPT